MGFGLLKARVRKPKKPLNSIEFSGSDFQAYEMDRPAHFKVCSLLSLRSLRMRQTYLFATFPTWCHALAWWLLAIQEAFFYPF